MKSSINQVEVSSAMSGACPVVTREREYLWSVAAQERRIEAAGRLLRQGATPPRR
jgi:hypothetical protein